MSEEVMTPITSVVEPTVEQQAAPTQLSAADLRMGYLVGLTKDGNFVFQVVGQEPGLVELLGLHQYAGLKVKSALDGSQNSGDKLVAEVGRAVSVLLQEVGRLSAALKKPDNKIG